MAILVVATACGGSVEPIEQQALSPQLFLGVDQAEINSVMLERELVFQTRVAECMAAEGFEYFPRDDTQQTEVANRAFNDLVGDEAEGLSHGLPSEAYATEWGYGVARRALAAADYSGFVPPVDRNDAYLDSLTEGELSAYANVLGPCERSADSEVFATVVEYENVAMTVAESVQQRIAADPGILALDRDWSSCVARTTTPDLIGAVPDRPVQVMFVFEDQANLSGVDPADEAFWSEFLQREREAAVAAVSCAERLNYGEIVMSRTRELEREELARLGFD